MTLTYRSLASSLLLCAVTISAAFQLYRAGLGTAFAVDRFGPETAVAYACLYLVAVAVRTDRDWIWWATALLLVAQLAYGVAVYYPTVHAARPLELLDWLEGTVYTGLLLAALGCAVLRLTGTTMVASPTSSALERVGPGS